MSRIWIGLILIVVLAGCQVQPEATPAELDRLQIELTPALDWLRPSFASCAADVPGIALTVETTFQAEQSLEQADILFRWSSSPPTSGEALKMGMDTLVLIVNPQNSLSE
jgi:DNA-binding transcriptional LysR family regulator